MSFRKLFLYTSFALVLAVAFAYFTKSDRSSSVESVAKKKEGSNQVAPVLPKEENRTSRSIVADKSENTKEEVSEKPALPKVDRIRRFYSKGMDKFPVVETITYSSRVPWLKGRPAWIADYASYYRTSRHFIARGLNGKPDYVTQNVSPGDKFNVLKPDSNIEFYLLVDLETCTLDFYYLDLDNDERVLVKNYEVGVGRKDAYSPSGSLTPTGKFKLGEKVAVYRPGIENYFQNRKTQMIEVFGTRWLPFEEEIENCTDSAKGYGIHGLPCKYDEEQKLLIEEEGIGDYSSDGCIRMQNKDMEELFAIVVTRPTVIEIVKNKDEAKLPMAKEKQL